MHGWKQSFWSVWWCMWKLQNKQVMCSDFLGGFWWLFLSSPLHNIDTHTEDLCLIIIFHSREWELRDKVSKMCFHNKNDAEKPKSYWLCWDFGKLPFISAARKQLLICQQSVLEVSQICSGLPAGTCIWLCDLVTWLLRLCEKPLLWVLNCNVI